MENTASHQDSLEAAPEREHVRLGLKDFAFIAKDAALAWSADNASRLSASLAYYAIFSLAPLLVIAIAIVGLVFGEEAARDQIAGEMSGWVGPDAARTIQDAVAAMSSKSASTTALIIGFATLLLGASTFFGELKNALNLIWGVTIKPGTPISTLIRDRILSFSMVLSIGFLLLVSLVISAAVAALSAWLAANLPLPAAVWKVLDFCLSVAVITALFAMIFKRLPNVILRWKDVLPGALLTALLFAFGKGLIAWYLGNSSAASPFAAAGSLIILLLWLYYASCILFLGAEFTKICTVRYGHPITPDQHAVLTNPPPSTEKLQEKGELNQTPS